MSVAPLTAACALAPSDSSTLSRLSIVRKAVALAFSLTSIIEPAVATFCRGRRGEGAAGRCGETGSDRAGKGARMG